MCITSDHSFSESSLAVFYLEVWVFSRVLRLLWPKLIPVSFVMFMSFKVDVCCVHGEKSGWHDLRGKCEYLLSLEPLF
jgi:hypothetical protein